MDADFVIDAPPKKRVNQEACSPFCAKLFRKFSSVVMILLISSIGGALMRINGGWLNFPQIDSSDSNVQILTTKMTTRLFAVAIPFGIMVCACFNEKKKHDPYAARKISLSIAATVFTWFSLYVDSSTYIEIARNSHSSHLPMGIFDWLIGHDCTGFTFWRSWFHQILGLSLYGLVITVPTGAWFYCYGYGWEYLLCGILMGGIYEVGFQFSAITQIGTGAEVAQAFWGALLWMVMFCVIAGKRKHARVPPVPFLDKQNIFFGIILVILDVLIIGSTIGYSFVIYKSQLIYRQTLMGLIMAFVGTIFIQIGFVAVAIIKRRNERKTSRMVNSGFDKFDAMDQMDDNWSGQLRINSKDSSNVELGPWEILFPPAKFPFSLILYIVRIFITIWGLFIIILLIDVVVYDRILQPCVLHWN